ncbi:hypothetical protein HN827_02835 [archaeon]|nr:hypothetical protein [archaeon]MBT4647184.1 hypothetical protein [archaeon]MBT6822187.1 hypothetical protein [archaeon]MBT7391738.1 hypothetical protein [archaeon]
MSTEENNKRKGTTISYKSMISSKSLSSFFPSEEKKSEEKNLKKDLEKE